MAIQFQAPLCLIALLFTMTVVKAVNEQEDSPCNPRLQARVIGDRCGACCRRMYQPVCGSDGETYDNDCALNVAICRSSGILSKAYEGECNDTSDTDE